MSLWNRFSKNCRYYINGFHSALFRKKSTQEFFKLKKVLNLFDVTLLCLGTTLGVGPYIFIGEYAKSMGPAMIVAYLIAAIVTLLAVACYGELTGRAGGSGGAYSCIYIYVGELPAIIVGWHLCLQNIIGSALTVRALSDLLDYTTNHTMSIYIKTNIIQFNTPLLGEYPDFISACIPVLILILQSFGLKVVSILNGILVTFNMFLLMLILAVSGSVVDWSYWQEKAKEGCGSGGFLPHGFYSIWKGCGLVFYAYLGLDSVLHAAGECKDPGRVIPAALIISYAMVFILYLFQSISYTVALPYCDQELEAPIPYLFENIGVSIMSWITTIGIPLALVGSALSSKFPVSRILYALSEDGLLYSYMAKLSFRTRSPRNALYTSAFLTGLCAILFNKKQLAELTCLTALLTYNITTVLVIYLRYTDLRMEEPKSKGCCEKMFNIRPRALVPTKTTSKIVGICCWLLILAAHPSLLLLQYGSDRGFHLYEFIAIAASSVFFFLIFVIISCQPKSEEPLAFKVKFVPLVPMISLYLNSGLSLTYEFYTWIRLLIFFGLGLFIYLTYGLWNSQLRKTGDQFYSGNY